jgi:hypothetical protein
LLEYAWDLAPKSPDAQSPFTGSLETLGGTPSLVVRFPRRKPPTDVAYEVQVSADFLTWQSGPTVAEELPPQSGSKPSMETARYRILASAGEPDWRFVRVRVARTTGSIGAGQ